MEMERWGAFFCCCAASWWQWRWDVVDAPDATQFHLLGRSRDASRDASIRPPPPPTVGFFFVRAGASFSFQSSFGECVCRYNNNSRLKCITSGREVMGRSMSTHFFHPPSPGNLSLAQKWSSSSSSGGGDAGLCNRSFPLGCWIRATFSLFDRSAACFWLEKKNQDDEAEECSAVVSGAGGRGRSLERTWRYQR